MPLSPLLLLLKTQRQYQKPVRGLDATGAPGCVSDTVPTVEGRSSPNLAVCVLRFGFSSLAYFVALDE